MSGDLYRDAHIGLRARIAELEARIEARESEVTETFWETLAPTLREQLAALRSSEVLAAPAAPAKESLEELTRDGAPSEEEAAAIFRQFGAMVRERAPDAEIIDLNPMYLARFTERGTPFALRATLYTQGNGHSLRWRFEPAPKALDAAMRILTAVRGSRPSVRFRNE